MTPQLRFATSDDVGALLGLWEAAAENESRPADTAAAVEALLGRDREACTVAEVDGRIVGSLISGWDGYTPLDNWTRWVKPL